MIEDVAQLQAKRQVILLVKYVAGFVNCIKNKYLMQHSCIMQ